MKNNALEIEGLWTIIRRLNDDCEICLTELDETRADDTKRKSFWRRMYARATVALVDAAIYRMTYHAYATSGRPGVTFSPAELEKLETGFDFEEDREPVTSFSKKGMLENIEFAFNSFARVHDCAYLLPVHRPEWVLIREIALLRQSWQFCREPEEIEVYDENVEVLLHGSQWLIECMVELLKSCLISASEGALPGELEDREIVM